MNAGQSEYSSSVGWEKQNNSESHTSPAPTEIMEYQRPADHLAGRSLDRNSAFIVLPASPRTRPAFFRSHRKVRHAPPVEPEAERTRAVTRHVTQIGRHSGLQRFRRSTPSRGMRQGRASLCFLIRFFLILVRSQIFSHAIARRWRGIDCKRSAVRGVNVTAAL